MFTVKSSSPLQHTCNHISGHLRLRTTHADDGRDQLESLVRLEIAELSDIDERMVREESQDNITVKTTPGERTRSILGNSPTLQWNLPTKIRTVISL